VLDEMYLIFYGVIGKMIICIYLNIVQIELIGNGVTKRWAGKAQPLHRNCESYHPSKSLELKPFTQSCNRLEYGKPVRPVGITWPTGEIPVSTGPAGLVPALPLRAPSPDRIWEAESYHRQNPGYGATHWF
jgi:hypothetical protein